MSFIEKNGNNSSHPLPISSEPLAEQAKAVDGENSTASLNATVSSVVQKELSSEGSEVAQDRKRKAEEISGGLSPKRVRLIDEKAEEMDLELELLPAPLPVPYELCLHILSYLGPKDLQQAANVNKSWQMAATDVAKRRSARLVRSFVECLISQLCDAQIIQSNALKEIVDDKQSESSTGIPANPLVKDLSTFFLANNLLEVKSTSVALRENILNVLKTLDDGTLKTLEEQSQGNPKPLYFEDLFIAARIYKRIDSTKEMPMYLRSYHFEMIIEELAVIGYIDKANEVARTDDNDGLTSVAFATLSKAVAQIGQIGQAIKFARLIDGSWLLPATMDKLAEVLVREALAQTGSTDCVSTIGDWYLNQAILRHISKMKWLN